MDMKNVDLDKYIKEFRNIERFGMTLVDICMYSLVTNNSNYKIYIHINHYLIPVSEYLLSI